MFIIIANVCFGLLLTSFGYGVLQHPIIFIAASLLFAICFSLLVDSSK